MTLVLPHPPASSRLRVRRSFVPVDSPGGRLLLAALAQQGWTPEDIARVTTADGLSLIVDSPAEPPQ